MLGIGQIERRIGELIRGAMPYAIVNNDPNQSRFSKLVSFSEVQRALDDGHKWIKVKASSVDYRQFAITTDNTRVDSCWGARFIMPLTGVGSCITVDANDCILNGLKTFTLGGVSSDDRRGFNIRGTDNIIAYCQVEDSDGSGFLFSATHSHLVGTRNKMIGCLVVDCDDYGVYSNVGFELWLGCTVLNAGLGVGWLLGSGATNFVAVANTVQGGDAFTMLSGADNGIMVGNLLDGTVNNAGSGNLLASNTYNKEY